MNPFRILPKTGTSLAEEWLQIGCDHQVNGKFPEALSAYEKGLKCEANHGPITANLGVLYLQQGKTEEGLRALERSLIFEPNNGTTWYNLALAYLEAGRIDQALTAIDESMKLGKSADSWCAYGMIKTSAGDSEAARDAYEEALKLDPKSTIANYNALFVRTLIETKPPENLQARRRWYENNKYMGPKKPHEKVKKDRLRVGYVSGDFKMHSAAFIFGAVVLNHKDVDVFCYSTMPVSDSDPMTQKFKKLNFRDIEKLDDEQAENLIRSDKIDILVDLSGFTGGNRLPLFTRKPAPIQVTAWGFAHGTGVDEIDYFFSDKFGLPEEERQYFTEEIYDLPATVTYLAPEYGSPGQSQAPYKKEDVFTFGVYGRFEKYSKKSLETYAEVMKKTKDTRIIFRDRSLLRPCSIRHIQKFFDGVDPKRVVFSSWGESHPEQLLSYQQADLVLDTFPHTGGVTSLEQLYMGVPILTTYNGQIGGRTTSIALNSMGRKEWISYSPEEFIEKAVKLSEEPKKLGEARHTLRDEFLNAPIVKGYVDEVEKGYKEMYQKWVS